MEGFVEEHDLIVISDFHLGNPAFVKNRNVVEFLEFVADQDASLCINGDGVDFLQPSMEIFASYLPKVAKRLFSMISGGKKVYYLIGNHDLFLEHFLYSWGGLEIAPFLNVLSGASRVHIEHGHLYDSIYSAYPGLYMWTGRVAGRIINIWPGFFRMVYRIEDLAALLRKKEKGEALTQYAAAAEHLLDRGFDIVIFGHTHRAQSMEIKDKIYMNPGAWEEVVHYIHIVNGTIRLARWE